MDKVFGLGCMIFFTAPLPELDTATRKTLEQCDKPYETLASCEKAQESVQAISLGIKVVASCMRHGDFLEYLKHNSVPRGTGVQP
jgi:hypothetical protein